jgi:hypothetical protein
MFLKIILQLLNLMNGKNATYVVLLTVCFTMCYMVFDITNKVHKENSELVKFLYDKKRVAAGLNVDSIGDNKSPISAITE